MAGKTRKIALAGLGLMRDPLLNKGSAFSARERRLFGLEGLLPARTLTIDVQRRRIRENLERIADPLEKYVALASLQDRNEHLFFNVLTHHLEELLPIVYTPTVALATQRFSHVFQRGRGIWITPQLRGRMSAVLRQVAGNRTIRLIVATDNESILGIGDQGAGGIAISIGKLALYTAAAGIDPAQVLPVSIDVGTNNEALLVDPFYLGWPEKRLRGVAYEELLEEFVTAVGELWPGALLQWEDFRKENALRVLDRFRDRVPSFNDDIQGTGAVALAGVLTAQRVTGRRLGEERIVIVGGGAAGLGIARQFRAAMAGNGVRGEDLRRAVATLDSKGLITDEATTDHYKAELAWPASYAADVGLVPGRRDLRSVVERYRPTVLIGSSGQPGAFDQEVVELMARHVERPVILPLSNPTSCCEACPADIVAWTDGRALVATGSPFPDVVHAGRRHRIAQGNNAYVFPGVGLGVLAGQLRRVDDAVFLRAAEALSGCVSREQLASGMLFPPISQLREVAVAVAGAVVGTAEAGKLEAPEDIVARIRRHMWEPEYLEYEKG